MFSFHLLQENRDFLLCFRNRVFYLNSCHCFIESEIMSTFFSFFCRKISENSVTDQSFHYSRYVRFLFKKKIRKNGRNLVDTSDLHFIAAKKCNVLLQARVWRSLSDSHNSEIPSQTHIAIRCWHNVNGAFVFLSLFLFDVIIRWLSVSHGQRRFPLNVICTIGRSE